MPERWAGYNQRTRVKAALSPDAPQKLIESMEQGYKEFVITLKQFGFLTESGDNIEGNAPLPNCEQIVKAFTPEKIKTAIHFDEPTLILIPETSFAAKIEAFKAHKPEKVNNIVVNPYYLQNDAGSGKITGWRASIMDGCRDKLSTDDGDDRYRRLSGRMDIRKKSIRPKSSKKGMDKDKWLMLMMAKLIQSGCPIDRHSATILDNDTGTKEGLVMIGFFDGDRGSANLICQADTQMNLDGRFRSSVDGDSLI